MPNILVSEVVYKRLQELARPFEDTPDSVLRRLLEIGESEAVVDEGYIRIELEQFPNYFERYMKGREPTDTFTLVPQSEPRRYSIRSSAGVIGNLSVQVRKKRAVIEMPIRKVPVERIGTESHKGPGGWYGLEDSYFWYVDFKGEGYDKRQYDRIVGVLVDAFRLRDQ